jgi:hypothetical protein
MGIGSRVKVFADGKLIGCQEIAWGYGYASAPPAITHFGLGEVDTVDLEVTLPHGAGTITKKGVKADQRITLQN